MPNNAQRFDTSPEGLSDLTYPHIEALGSRGSRVVYHTPSLLTQRDANSGLIMFRIESVFGNTDSVLIGCGTPNVATSVYDAEAKTWKRMSAFMLYREKSHVSSLTELQAGVYFELRNVAAETRQKLLSSMNAHSNMRGPSCAHLNASVLHDAGFNLGGGRDIRRVIRPSRLANLIWRYGLELDGQPVDMRLINTSKLDVGDHFVGVWWKEVNSPIRLVKKMVAKSRQKLEVAPTPAQPTALRAPGTWTGVPVTVWMNRPSLFGVGLTFLWGRHAEFRVLIPTFVQSPDLQEPLLPFPGQLSRLSKLKKHVLFSKPVVRGINRIKNSGFDRYDEVPLDATLEMLQPADDHDQRVLWSFALVKHEHTYEVRLSPLKNQDPLSQESKLRRVSNWILAKHVVASGYHPETVYAGEAWMIRGPQTRQLTMCLNDNSGTYKPSVEQLEVVASLVRGLGLDVMTFPRSAL